MGSSNIFCFRAAFLCDSDDGSGGGMNRTPLLGLETGLLLEETDVGGVLLVEEGRFSTGVTENRDAL